VIYQQYVVQTYTNLLLIITTNT